jgi:hypothetical protein
MDLSFPLAAMLSVATLGTTTALHHQALYRMTQRLQGRPLSHFGVVLFLVALVSVHLADITLYAGAYAIGARVLALGHLRGSTGRAGLDFFYFAAETYSTLGYGDIVPEGALRLVASIEALNGMLLLAWSGAFLFGILEGRGQRP